MNWWAGGALTHIYIKYNKNRNKNNKDKNRNIHRNIDENKE